MQTLRPGCSKVRTPPARPPACPLPQTHRQERLQYTATQHDPGSALVHVHVDKFHFDASFESKNRTLVHVRLAML